YTIRKLSFLIWERVNLQLKKMLNWLQVATDKGIMLFLFLIICGVIAIIVVKILNPNNKDVTDIPGLAPPAQTRRLLYLRSREHFD
ncbi:hypothetical protein S245_003037, partial [Arachis hypogaea]